MIDNVNNVHVVETTVTTTKRGKITEARLRDAFGIPDNATIRVWIPGGGDWSSTHLDVTELIVEWTETKRTVGP